MTDIIVGQKSGLSSEYKSGIIQDKKRETSVAERIEKLPVPVKVALGIFTAPLWLILGLSGCQASSAKEAPVQTTQQKQNSTGIGNNEAIPARNIVTASIKDLPKLDGITEGQYKTLNEFTVSGYSPNKSMNFIGFRMQDYFGQEITMYIESAVTDSTGNWLMAVNNVPVRTEQGDIMLIKTARLDFGVYFALDDYGPAGMDFSKDSRTIVPIESELNQLLDVEKYMAAGTAVSFRPELLPAEVQDVLRRIKTGNAYENYYNYVATNVDRIIFCPHLNVNIMGNDLGGAVSENPYKHNNAFYPEERVIFIDSNYDKFLAGNELWKLDNTYNLLNIISLIVHETAHQEITRLTQENKVSSLYLHPILTLNERFAYLTQIKFLEGIMTIGDDTTVYAAGILKDEYLKIIAACNKELGLDLNDKRLFPYGRLAEIVSIKK
ncbi:MAG: hypothetical protein LBK68_02690 [Candidatus Margulisbacteria bacterium]|jgi:hypothetical protein|nr:hypothetical protein [Candidatus Margulisiibacteriota bacterium]